MVRGSLPDRVLRRISRRRSAGPGLGVQPRGLRGLLAQRRGRAPFRDFLPVRPGRPVIGPRFPRGAGLRNAPFRGSQVPAWEPPFRGASLRAGTPSFFRKVALEAGTSERDERTDSWLTSGACQSGCCWRRCSPLAARGGATNADRRDRRQRPDRGASRRWSSWGSARTPIPCSSNGTSSRRSSARADTPGRDGRGRPRQTGRDGEALKADLLVFLAGVAKPAPHVIVVVSETQQGLRLCSEPGGC